MMSGTVTSALSNYMWRRNAERVQTEEPEERDTNSIIDDDEENNMNNDYEEEGQFVGGGRTTSTDNSSVASTLESLPDDEDVITSSTTSTGSDVESPSDNNNNNLATEEETTTTTPTTPLTESSNRTTTTASTLSRDLTRDGVTLRELEEERTIVQRRAGSCILLSGFFLFQLWVQALASGDFGLLLLCLLFTSWTARFIRYTREQEAELSRRIENWDENAADNNNGEGTSSVMEDARRLRRMSFQSQLALAVIQSQIQMMEGGYGHPDGASNNSPGLSDAAKNQWDRFTFKDTKSLLERGGNYYNASAKKGGSSGEDNAPPECTICLCEYETGDNLVSLPCKHVFHEECVTSWTDHNTRCPLCNTDLEGYVSQQPGGDEAV